MNYSTTYDNGTDVFKAISFRVARLVACVMSCMLAGFIGSVYVKWSINNWYRGLTKPWFTPPNWAFAPVWIIIFVFMGISVFIVWENTTTNSKSRALVAFYIQLAANICWSIAFFGMCSTLGGLIIAICLLGLILLTVKRFYSISKIAASLLVPYLLWVCFATILNFSIYYLNL